MTDQLRINDHGEIESQPLTWDGEPVYSPSTVREGLFDPEAFEQMRGQMAMDEPPSIGSFVSCPRCGRACRVLPHNSAHCVQCFTGFRTDRL